MCLDLQKSNCGTFIDPLNLQNDNVYKTNYGKMRAKLLI